MTHPLRQAAIQAERALQEARHALYGNGPGNPRLDLAIEQLSAALALPSAPPACPDLHGAISPYELAELAKDWTKREEREAFCEGVRYAEERHGIPKPADGGPFLAGDARHAAAGLVAASPPVSGEVGDFYAEFSAMVDQRPAGYVRATPPVPAPDADRQGKDERETFEAWAIDNHWNLRCIGNGQYLFHDAAAGWQAWQARSALAAPPATEGSALPIGGWQPIETAPEQCEWLLLAAPWDSGWAIKMGYRSSDLDASYGWKILGASWKPTHWMPLPDAPASARLPAKDEKEGA